jgi:hypothetical protein
MAQGLHVVPLARHFIPAPLRQTLKHAYLRRKLDSALGRIVSDAPAVPSLTLLEDLQVAWDNQGFGGRTDYLHEVASRAAAATGPILECGSGLTTLLIAAMSATRGIPYCSLEHMAEWRDRVAGVLARHDLPVGVWITPLRDFGDYSWYDAPIPGMPDEFSLVICDGPPGQTKGGRYGLLPRMAERLASGATILLDDVDRPGEMDVLARWRAEAGLRTELRDTYAIAYVDGGFRLKPEATGRATDAA